ncbi:hypothetical protein BN1723_003441 [Verticillium longisporum]|uniref:Phosphoinositide phospholipase C n=1 Tax=Verticillium longisporum TaxID=100787 RepID=A0A0G4LZ02_VERLO|nr:hypothetical protein BN1723_003441 [Verticillium longisporum]
MCFIFPRRRPRDNDKAKRSLGRTVTMPIFSRTNKDSLPTLRNMVNLSTILTPTKGAWLDTTSSTATTTTPRTTATTRSLPRINVNGLDHHPDLLDDIISPILARTDIPSFYTNDPRNIDVNNACMDKLRRAFDDLLKRRSMIRRETTISRDQFVAWLESMQGESPTDVEKHLPEDKDRYTQGEFLEAWLMRFDWDAERPACPDKDTSRPITNYFISSSHNTYLEGNQLASKSSPEAYREVLSRGCRCIEIDVWNGDTVAAGSETTRNKSPRPDHSRNLSGASFANVAASLKETVGGVLGGGGAGDRASTHSRRLSAQSSSGLGLRDSGFLSDTRVSGDKLDGGAVVVPPCPPSPRLPYPKNEPIVTHGWTLTTPCGFREVCVAIRASAFVTNDLPIIISLEVHADHQQQEVMVAIMKEEWGDMLIDRAMDGIDQRFRVPSLEELRGKILIKCKKPPKKIEVPLGPMRLTKSRTQEEDTSASDEENASQQQHRHHPSGAAPKSPPPTLGAPPKAAKVPGVQMVALNWQYLDEGMMLNEGMFAGEQGWVLKPPGYRTADKTCFAQADAPHAGTLMLSISILAGQHIWAPESTESDSGWSGRNLRPLVKCELHVERPGSGNRVTGGSGGASYDGKYKLETAPMKTSHPDWGDKGELLKFPLVPRVVEELSFVRTRTRTHVVTEAELTITACTSAHPDHAAPTQSVPKRQPTTRHTPPTRPSRNQASNHRIAQQTSQTSRGRNASDVKREALLTNLPAPPSAFRLPPFSLPRPAASQSRAGRRGEITRRIRPPH